MTEQDTAPTVDAPVETDDTRDEADIAADYIEELLDICDLDGDIEIEERGGRVYLSVTDEGGALRVLSKPDTVSARVQARPPVCRRCRFRSFGESSPPNLAASHRPHMPYRPAPTLLHRGRRRADAPAQTLALAARSPSL